MGNPGSALESIVKKWLSEVSPKMGWRVQLRYIWRASKENCKLPRVLIQT